MSSDTDFQPDEQIEAYLDGLLPDAERQAFAESLRTDPARRRQVELQARIDGALEQMFQVEAPSREQMAALLAGALGAGSPPAAAAAPTVPFTRGMPQATAGTPAGAGKLDGAARPNTYWAAAALLAAASIAWVMLALLWDRSGGGEPLFAARPLVDIYQDAVAAGFEPSYECHEPDRFAATFIARQGQSLRLLPAPTGTRMLGLSYVGGLSRQTTAMLCEVDGARVMVFVDRASADRADVAAEATGLRVFRQDRDGLVFYEVTPLDAPRVTELIVPAEDAAAEAGANANASTISALPARAASRS